MPTPAQAGGALAGVAILAGGGYGITYYVSGKQDTKAPEAITFKGDEILPPYSAGILGIQSNRDKLVKPNEPKNESWWKHIFPDRFKESEKKNYIAPFNDVTDAYGNTTKSLNKACDEAYTQTIDKLKEIDSSLLNAIQRFCSLNPQQPLNLLSEPTKDVSTFSNTTALSAEYNDKLISVFKQSNRDKFVKAVGTTDKTEEWWFWSFTDGFNRRTPNNNSQLHSVFHEVTTHYSKDKLTGSQVKQKALNQACDEAYRLNRTEYKFETHLVKNITSFCTMSVPQTTDLTEPNPPVTHSGTTTVANTEYKNGLLTKEANRSKLVKDEASNEQWWRWTYATLVSEQQNYSSPFTNLTTYGDGVTAINKACDASYKQVKNQFTSALLEKIKQLCTINPKEASALAKPDNDEAEPTSTNLVLTSSDTGYKSAFAKNTTNQGKLVNPAKTDSETWWKWSYNNRFPFEPAEKAKLPRLFQKVDKGYEALPSAGSIAEQPTALNQACKVAYNKPKVELDDAPATQGHKKLVETIKALCATKTASAASDNFTLEDPTFTPLNDTTSYTGGVGAVDTNKDKLSKPIGGDNEEWWESRLYELKKANVKGNTTLSDLFKKATIAYKQDKDENESTVNSLNNICGIAYTKKQDKLNEGGKKLLNNIKDYCTKDKTEPDTTNVAAS